MSTTDQTHQKNQPSISGRRYSTVTEMMASEGVPNEVQEKVRILADETRISRILARLRAAHGLTQEEMGQKIGISQSAVSKLESGRDGDLTLADIKNYATALGERIGVMFGKPVNSVEAIKIHAMGMRHHMLELTKIAAIDAEMDRHIQAFFGEAFFNILDILSTCHSKMPNGVEGCEMRMEVISMKPMIERSGSTVSVTKTAETVMV